MSACMVCGDAKSKLGSYYSCDSCCKACKSFYERIKRSGKVDGCKNDHQCEGKDLRECQECRANKCNSQKMILQFTVKNTENNSTRNVMKDTEDQSQMCSIVVSKIEVARYKEEKLGKTQKNLKKKQLYTSRNSTEELNNSHEESISKKARLSEQKPNNQIQEINTVQHTKLTDEGAFNEFQHKLTEDETNREKSNGQRQDVRSQRKPKSDAAFLDSFKGYIEELISAPLADIQRELDKTKSIQEEKDAAFLGNLEKYKEKLNLEIQEVSSNHETTLADLRRELDKTKSIQEEKDAAFLDNLEKYKLIRTES